MRKPGFSLSSLMDTRRDDMGIKIRARGGDISVNICDELYIDEEDLDTEFGALPGQMGYWGMLVGRYEKLISTMEREFKNWYAQKYQEKFDILQKETGRRPNINSVEYMVLNQHGEEHDQRQEDIDSAKADFYVIKTMPFALNSKQQCLTQIAKRRLLDLEATEPSVREFATTDRRSSKKEEQSQEAESIFRNALSRGDKKHE